ncbi:MAG TPA: fibronectin type III domain-containing protein [Terracidiphilus sp.]|nr:fibronectin type III domain-containing protein [Terracidiphilus sp.]
MHVVRDGGCATAAIALAALLTGCGTPGAPQAPSLNLPARVADLQAVRTGNQVLLTWTNPARNTDNLPMKDSISVAICRQQPDEACEPAATLSSTPGMAGKFTETLPPDLASGAARPLTYFVELKNARGRSAGRSNGAESLAGAAPGQITGLTAEQNREGIVLHWLPDGEETAIRLRRTMLTAPEKRPQQGLLAPPSEPAEQNLLVMQGGPKGIALDKDIQLGQTYEYRAQRVIRIYRNGTTLELDSDLSAPVRIAAVDRFPPAAPSGLVGVASTSQDGTQPTIDLSWRPNREGDLAGYIVYRREGNLTWQRISPAPPLAGPAFSDAHVLPGHTYTYSVSAIDQTGHESPRSDETQETVPTQ